MLYLVGLVLSYLWSKKTLKSVAAWLWKLSDHVGLEVDMAVLPPLVWDIRDASWPGACWQRQRGQP